jgi:hypothetical protein
MNINPDMKMIVGPQDNRLAFRGDAEWSGHGYDLRWGMAPRATIGPPEKVFNLPPRHKRPAEVTAYMISIQIKPVPGFSFSGATHRFGAFRSPGNASSRAFGSPGKAKTFRLAGSLSAIFTDQDVGVSSNGKGRRLGGSKATE